MSKHVVMSIFDSKAEAYLPPFFTVSRGVGIRSFSDAAQDEKHEFSRHAGDYTLFELGEFDLKSGRFEQYDAAVNLGTAIQFLAKPLKAVERGSK